MGSKYDISEKNLNSIIDVMNAGKERYAVDEMLSDGFFTNAFKKYPLNNEAEIVAMKMSLVDTTNSTNLGRLLGNKEYMSRGKLVKREVFAFSELINKILSMKDFDERVKNGDPSLVSELTKWGAERGANMMSFFSKYCLYHNYHAYGRDDYSIFDSIVRENLGSYITEEEYEMIFGMKLRKSKLEKTQALANAVNNRLLNMKDQCNYEGFLNVMNKILELRGINEKNVPKMRRKLDLLVWYSNR